MNFRERIDQGRQNQNRPEPANRNDQQEAFDFNFFGIGNIHDHIACVDFRLADGSRKALTYSYVMGIDYDASEGIELHTAAKSVKIIGRDLAKLYDYLVMFRVKYIQANMGMDVGKSGLFVKDIVVTEV